VEFAVFERKLDVEYASVLNENPVLFVCNRLVFLGLKVQVSIGERMLVGLATGTAVFLTPLPMPPGCCTYKSIGPFLPLHQIWDSLCL